MEKITIKQFLAFTNRYVPVYIENEFAAIYKDKVIAGTPDTLYSSILKFNQMDCPIDYIRNVDGGHRDDEKKKDCAIVLGISDENWEKYFGSEGR